MLHDMLQMRPYNVQNVVDNLRGRFSKKVVLQTLTELADDGLIERKMYGKVAMFVALRPGKGESPQIDPAEEMELESLRDRKAALEHQVQMLRKIERQNRVDPAIILRSLRARVQALDENLRAVKAQLANEFPDVELARLLALNEKYTKLQSIRAALTPPAEP
ncbi:Tat-binding protein 1(TBP-1)-interacting (TBPIP) protein [Gregarina niphandrodes]|uniref:Tat-binding protein 1(TBP-1)-interacting (TBPIP) protein n=1 Tax=Gregarina niphandrodes TaxID=110365 RepID=A0A023BA90_GRENI|nr:Tat-binding protein 1(TBP-1)-interacting (TBPIP) protein [Gregarina niphandrodes]EZG78161.1 Tat-binding protein 1(TBP-1)-interacting (TBPIP) protein [Gregarina niphandrodes]|eukprot:XP_011129447.1 Tat-binding protein 1(TBP-1)-interacting (TBPIP) protein [Gregarina niphandrodes]